PSKPSRYEIDTVTTSSRLKLRPSYHGLAGDPAKKPPPCIQTSTGRPSSGATSRGDGVKTFTLSVLKPATLGSGISVTPGSPRCAVAPNSRASRTPSQGAFGTGAAKRR